MPCCKLSLKNKKLCNQMLLLVYIGMHLQEKFCVSRLSFMNTVNDDCMHECTHCFIEREEIPFIHMYSNAMYITSTV